MEIRRWLYYSAVNCALVYCIVVTPFSLNKLIEAESQQKKVVHTTITPKLEGLEPDVEQFSHNKSLKPLSRITKKFKETGTTFNLIPFGKKISPLKYRKTFQIKSPLKPKRVKLSLKTRHKRKNEFIKKDTEENVLNRKYIPLLRNLGMLFDNILGTDSGESIEIRKRKKRLRYIPERHDEAPCKCPQERNSNAELKSEEKTVTSSEALTTEVSVITEAAPETAVNTPTGNLRGIRRNKNIPLLLPRNTFGPRRDNNGFSEGSRTTHNGSAERDISGDNGDSEPNPEWRQDESDAKSNEENTDSDSRNNASSIRFRGAIRGRESRNKTEEVNENETLSKDETSENSVDDIARGGDTTEYYKPDKFKTGRDEAKSAKLLPEPVQRQREFLSEGHVINNTKPVQSKEYNEKSNFSVTYNSSCDQRIINGNGPYSTKDQKVNERNETMIHKLYEVLESPQNVFKNTFKPSRTKGPVVVIIDGYSVTRHKNGENKLAEKTIRIRP